jgi:hypothetical protein
MTPNLETLLDEVEPITPSTTHLCIERLQGGASLNGRIAYSPILGALAEALEAFIGDQDTPQYTPPAVWNAKGFGF